MIPIVAKGYTKITGYIAVRKESLRKVLKK